MMNIIGIVSELMYSYHLNMHLIELILLNPLKPLLCLICLCTISTLVHSLSVTQNSKLSLTQFLPFLFFYFLPPSHYVQALLGIMS